LDATFDDLAEIAEVFDRRIVTAMPDGFQPELIIGDEFKVEFSDIQIGDLIFPLEE